MWLKFIPNGLIDNKPAIFQVMAWSQTGNKPLPEPSDPHLYNAIWWWDKPLPEPMLTHAYGVTKPK